MGDAYLLGRRHPGPRRGQGLKGLRQCRRMKQVEGFEWDTAKAEANL